MANVAHKSFEEVLTQGRFKAVVRFDGSGYSAHVTGPGMHERQSFHSLEAAMAYARLKLHEIDPGHTAVSGMGDVMHRFAMSNPDNPYDDAGEYTLDDSEDDDGEYEDDDDEDGGGFYYEDSEGYEEPFDEADEEDLDDMANDLYDEVRDAVEEGFEGLAPEYEEENPQVSRRFVVQGWWKSDPGTERAPDAYQVYDTKHGTTQWVSDDASQESKRVAEARARDLNYVDRTGRHPKYSGGRSNPRIGGSDFSNLTLQVVTLIQHHGIDMGRESKARRWPSATEMRKKFKEALKHVEPEVGKLSGAAKAQLQSVFFQGYRTGHSQSYWARPTKLAHRSKAVAARGAHNPSVKERFAHAIVATDEHELWTMENPATRPSGLASITINSGNEKTGMSATTYAANPSCPTAHNSSRACPFLDSGCYGNVGRVGIQMSMRNSAAGGKHSSKVTPEDIANDEAASILTAIESIKAEQTKGSRNKKTSVFNPLRLHVAGDCVTAKAASILADATSKWGNKVWTYTHAWRDVPRSAWGHISVLASCETLEDIKKAHARGYAVAYVQPHKTFEDKQPRKDSKLGMSWMPCPNEAVHSDIKCGPNPEGKFNDPRVATGCRLCWHDRTLGNKVIVFISHSQQADRIITAINKLDGTKVRV